MVDLSAIVVSAEILKLIPKPMALEWCALPIAVENDSLVVVLPDDCNPAMKNDITFLIGKNVRVETAPTELLSAAIRRLYGDVEGGSGKHTRGGESHPEIDGGGVPASTHPAKSLVSTNGSVVNMATTIISDAIQRYASDIHIEPYAHALRVRYRLDGVLHEVLQPSLDKAKPLISRFKIMADLDIAEKRRPQDGRIRVEEAGHMIDIRVSTLPTDFGEKIVLRILDKSHLQLDLSKLGFQDKDLGVFRRTIRLPYGMILVTGPTGSGKTTTLYAALNHINTPETNITTIEDPIEYNLPGINQTHVKSDIGLTFAAILRSILRQDPNVIMLGEIRDAETAEIAIRAALTGHLVFSTLHTNDALSAITRLTDMGIEPFLVAASVKMILAQRLLRTLCAECKTPLSLSDQDVEEFRIEGLKAGDQFFAQQGCPSCNHVGYAGRTAVYEVLPIQNGLSDLIARSAPSAELREKARAAGFQTLRDAALAKARCGVTTLEEVIRETTL
jgi:type IV pilus assembly protein PilB